VKVKILSGVVVAGKGYEANKVVELPDREARFLIAIGKATDNLKTNTKSSKKNDK